MDFLCFFCNITYLNARFAKAIYGWSPYKEHNVVLTTKQTNLMFFIMLFT
jgi:hypothetical protein